MLPLTSHLAQIFSQLDGGAEVRGELLWLSVSKYPVGSIVYVSTQGGYYKVDSRSSYEGYTSPHFFEYVLKGVNQDATNPVSDATDEGQLSDNLRPYPGG